MEVQRVDIWEDPRKAPASEDVTIDPSQPVLIVRHKKDGTIERDLQAPPADPTLAVNAILLGGN